MLAKSRFEEEEARNKKSRDEVYAKAFFEASNENLPDKLKEYITN